MTAIRPLSSSLGFKSEPVFRIDIACSNNLLQRKVRDFNRTCQEDRKKTLKAAPAALGEKILRLYKNHFQIWNTKTGYSWRPGAPLPALELNNQFLGEIMSCTDRTIRNYRARLVEIGLIVETTFHGTNAPFEVQLNPDFLHFCTSQSAQRIPLPVQNFPHTRTGTLELELTGTVSGKKCEVTGTEPEPGCGNLTPVTGTELEPNWNEASSNLLGDVQGEKTGTPPRVPAAPPTPPAGAAPEVDADQPDDPDQPHREKAARALLAFMLPKLYPGRHWKPAEKWAILQVTLRLFAGVPKENLSKVLENYAYRCWIAVYFYERETGKPIPYPTEFFNPDNPTGFRITRAWAKDPDRFTFTNPSRRLPVLGTPTTNDRRNGQVSLYELLNG
jgi:hypothetical protein